MGADKIQDEHLESIGVQILEKDPDGDRKLKIFPESLPRYRDLIKEQLNLGYWNEVVGENEIIFIFKSKDGSIKEYNLTPENEAEIAALCSQFNGDSLEKTSNVYKYISGNSLYKDFMNEHYGEFINRLK